MMDRPIIQLQRNKADRTLDTLSFIVLIGIFAISIYCWYNLPAIIPIHFDAAGNPDSHGRKETLFMLPGIAVLIYIFITYLNKHPHWFNYPVKITAENAFTQYTAACRMMRILKLSIMLIFFIIMVCSYFAGSGAMSKLPVWLLPVIILLAIGPVFYYLLASSKKRQ